MGWLKAPSLFVCDGITVLEPRIRPAGPDLKETKRDGWAGRRRKRRDRRRRMIQVRNPVERSCLFGELRLFVAWGEIQARMYLK